MRELAARRAEPDARAARGHHVNGHHQAGHIGDAGRIPPPCTDERTRVGSHLQPLGLTLTKKPFVITEYVRWGDIDLAGIICYGAYIRFYEIAETEIFRAAGLPFGDMFERYDMWLPRKVMHTEFHSPARLDEHLKVVTYFSRVGRSSLTINFDVMSADDNTLHASAYQVLVCVSRQGFEKLPLPPELVRAIDPFVMPVEAARQAA